MRVVCLVPSLTESLIDCGVQVVGRTRFCVHPVDQVSGIQVVGGTKDVDWEACSALRPDLVVLDREENTREMADSCPFPWTALHITAVQHVGPEMMKLARKVGSGRLEKLADDWIGLAQRPATAFAGWRQIPGGQTYLPGGGRRGDRDGATAISRLEYVIWRKPWMVIGPDTFIHSMLQTMGLGDFLPSHESRYVEVSEADMKRKDTFYLFSTEPYPFAEKQRLLESLRVAGSVVDGECYSWYGLRSYRFLEGLLSTRAV